ncbi:unnamed protein product [Allacma fusca]|uniref:Uncharacterized protein n=1 Tax=Allacma fusca TaxID=39272 RepID=A0A8J2L131_9HEXA|nr:unnamed protein product [Allacma fusca]
MPQILFGYYKARGFYHNGQHTRFISDFYGVNPKLWQDLDNTRHTYQYRKRFSEQDAKEEPKKYFDEISEYFQSVVETPGMAGIFLLNQDNDPDLKLFTSLCPHGKFFHGALLAQVLGRSENTPREFKSDHKLFVWMEQTINGISSNWIHFSTYLCKYSNF